MTDVAMLSPAPARLLFVMDPYAGLNLETETSLLLIEELLTRGHKAWWAEPDDIDLDGDRLRIHARQVLDLSPFRLGAPLELDAGGIDAVLIRKDPPFDSNYLHLTQLLDRLPPRVLQVNPARALREFNEKLSAMRFPAHSPEALVSLSAERLGTFVRLHGEAVIKPLDDCSGRGITFLRADHPALDAELASLLRDRNGRPRYLQAQAYLPAISNGDKRVYLVDGDVAGIVNRIPREGSRLGNIHQGARVEAAALTADEAACVAGLKPWLQRHGLLLVGADFIGGRLTELNITSPSAVRQINAVSGTHVERHIVDVLLSKIRQRADALGVEPVPGPE